MTTQILDHPEQLETERFDIAPTRGITAGELQRDAPPGRGDWIVLEISDHDRLMPTSGRGPADAMLRVKIRGALPVTIKLAQAGISYGRHCQSLLHDAGLHDIHVEVQFRPTAGDSRAIGNARALIYARSG
jgi:hypothetical protein